VLASICVNSTGQVYSVINTAGSSYNWTIPTGAAITNGSGTNSVTVSFGTASGNIAVTETNANGCTGVQQTKSLTINALLTTAQAGIDQNITTTSSVLTGNTASVGTGNWSLISGTGTLTDNSMPTSAVTSLGAGTNVFRWTITNATCFSFDDVNINVSIPLSILEEPAYSSSSYSIKDSYYFSPNPFEQSAVLKLNSDKNTKVSIKLIDMRGVCWYTLDNHDSNESISIGKDLPAGVYTVILVYSDTLHTFKVIKTE
jgi:hypothetical protein